ncbi:MAG: hypothetical protein ACTSP4_17130, partial [Candidatus Hodarchaeales archaeon]
MPGLKNEKFNRLMIDFGSENFKTLVYDSEHESFSKYLKFKNRIFKFRKRKKKALKEQDIDSEEFQKIISSRYLTKKEVQQYNLRAFIEEVPVKPHWLSRNVHVLQKTYQNIIEIVEDNLNIPISDNKDNWTIQVALPLTEHEETFNLISRHHEKACQKIGFNHFEGYNQLHLSADGEFEEIQKKTCVKQKNIRLVVDIGSYDIKSIAYSSKPIQTTARRETIGGMIIRDQAMKLSRMMDPCPDRSLISQWLIEHAHVYNSTRAFKVKSKNGQEFDISKITRTPELLFNPEKYGLEKKSLTGLIVETIEAASRLTGPRLISFYLNCIILSGGGAKYGGIVEKLVEELETRYPRQR